MSQIVRNLEAAYLLTTEGQSQYRGWDFRYLFICPDKAMRYKSTYYSYALGEKCQNVEATLGNYAKLLSESVSDWNQNDERRNRFAEFQKSVAKKVAVISWCQLGARLAVDVPDWFSRYKDRLSECADIEESELNSIHERLSAVGINI